MTAHLFIVRKIVMADSAQEAIEKESSVPVQDVVLAAEQPAPPQPDLDDLIGFDLPAPKEEDEV